MDAKRVTGRMRQWIYRKVHQRSLRRNQLRILTATWVDPEGFAADERGYVVRIQAGGIDDRTCGDGLRWRTQLDLGRPMVGADERRTWKDDRSCVSGELRQRSDECFGFDDSSVRRIQRRTCVDVRLARADEHRIDDAKPL